LRLETSTLVGQLEAGVVSYYMCIPQIAGAVQLGLYIYILYSRKSRNNRCVGRRTEGPNVRWLQRWLAALVINIVSNHTGVRKMGQTDGQTDRQTDMGIFQP